MGSDGSIKVGTGGNTITPVQPRISPSKRWCFTLNNYTKEDIGSMVPIFSHEGSYIFQEEIGENGTPHLQGYIEFNRKLRPLSLNLNPKIHWEKAKGNRQQNIEYCSKDDTKNGKVYTNMRIPKKLKLIDRLLPWQDELFSKLMEEPDDRTINWYWETTGGVGKSAFTKLMCAKHHAIVLSGKGADMKYGILKYIEKHGVAPDIIIIDVPRHTMDYISYTGIEEVKNGCFFSPKYESDMCIFNSPHIVVFANQPPDYTKMSEDRWNVVNI